MSSQRDVGVGVHKFSMDNAKNCFIKAMFNKNTDNLFPLSLGTALNHMRRVTADIKLKLFLHVSFTIIFNVHQKISVQLIIIG